jgi:hypothetical protein
MGITASGPLDLATFDGDVTLYDDGKSLEPQNEVISRIIRKHTPTCPSTCGDNASQSRSQS